MSFSESLILDLLRRYKGGLSIKKAARLLGIDRQDYKSFRRMMLQMWRGGKLHRHRERFLLHPMGMASENSAAPGARGARARPAVRGVDAGRRTVTHGLEGARGARRRQRGHGRGGHPSTEKRRAWDGWQPPESVEKERAAGMEEIRREFDLPGAFSERLLREARRAVNETKLDAPGRFVLTGLPLLTIDPADARDHDDAISLQELPGGTRRLGVHIADVSAYVSAGGALEREAFARGNSTYFYLDTIPMLPPQLSGEVCSLLAERERPAVSVFIDYDSEGRVLHMAFAESLLKVERSLSYEEAEAALDAEDDTGALMRAMLRLSAQLAARRGEGGALQFELPETLPLDEGEGVVAFRPARLLRSHAVVEEFMLAANHELGRLLEAEKLPHLRRVHEDPDPEDVLTLDDYLARQKVAWHPPVHPSPLDYRRLTERLAGRPDAERLTYRLLRSLKKARYSEVDLGHFGLAWRDYLHFTSPIRRFADLLSHRLLKSLLAEKGVPDETGAIFLHRQAKAPALGPSARRDRPRDRRDWSGLFPRMAKIRHKTLRNVAEAINEREILSIKAERAGRKLEMVLWARRRLGSAHDARILEVLPTGLVLTLPESGVEGFLPARLIGNEYFIWDEERESMRGERSGKVFARGDEFRVLITDANIFSRRLQFLLEEDIASNDNT